MRVIKAALSPSAGYRRRHVPPYLRSQSYIRMHSSPSMCLVKTIFMKLASVMHLHLANCLHVSYVLRGLKHGKAA